MKIITVDNTGKTATIECRKIEPATLASGNKIIIDECRVIDMADVVAIVN